MRNLILSCFGWCAMTVLGVAQAPPPGASVSGGGGGDYRSSTAEGGADRIFDVNSDSVDMENGSMQWKGKTFNLGNSRAMRMRFERYLASPAASGDLKRYLGILDQIDHLLAPNAINKNTYYANQQEAFNLLFQAAEFEFDGGNSLTIASQVKKVWAMRQEFRELEVTKNQLEALRKTQEGVVINRADKIEAANDERSSQPTKAGQPSLAKSTTGNTELAYRVKDEQRTQAEILAKNAEMTALGLKAQVEFQSQMVGFLLARRYHHCLISSAFYRVLFKSGNQNVKVGAKEVKEFFPVSDFVPTLESVDVLCREAMADVNTGMRTVDDLVKQGELYSAFERLQETYFLGEFEPAVMNYPQDKKREMLELWRDLRELQRLGDERDLANVEGYINKIRGRARDFPGAPILSKVNNAINASNMAVLSAKNAALNGDTTKAEAQLERATKIWPLNPAVKDFANQVVSRQDTLAQKIPEFDRMISEAKWRDIYNKKLEFALALAQDKARSDKLREVVNRIGELDANIQKASVLASQNNPYLAWDVIVETSRKEPDDLVLAKTRSEIAPLVADYARLIGLAEKLEKEGGEAAALTAWLSAQDLNPASPACSASVKRLAMVVVHNVGEKATTNVPAPPTGPANPDELAVPPKR